MILRVFWCVTTFLALLSLAARCNEGPTHNTTLDAQDYFEALSIANADQERRAGNLSSIGQGSGRLSESEFLEWLQLFQANAQAYAADLAAIKPPDNLRPLHNQLRDRLDELIKLTEVEIDGRQSGTEAALATAVTATGKAGFVQLDVKAQCRKLQDSAASAGSTVDLYCDYLLVPPSRVT